jgi:hypothetical protein
VKPKILYVMIVYSMICAYGYGVVITWGRPTSLERLLAKGGAE